MILAAEELIAQNGLRGVSLREINIKAGIRNASAVQYHFGSMKALVAAVATHRMAGVNVKRWAMLETVHPQNILGLVRCMVIPLAMELAERPEGNHYLRFVEQLSRDPDGAQYVIALEVRDAWLRIEDMVKELMSGFGEAIIDLRIPMVRALIVSGLADIEAQLDLKVISRSLLPALVSALVDAVVATFSSPPTQALLDAIGDLPAADLRWRSLTIPSDR